MLGAITGDICGSVYEFRPFRGHWSEIQLFAPHSVPTDDTILTLAVAEALMNISEEAEASDIFADSIRAWGKAYPGAGYGSKFAQWLFQNKSGPYNSFGNGSAMRVSPVAWAYDRLADVEKYAEISAAVTHNHPEGIKGACAIAGSIFLARNGKGKQEIREYSSGKYGYRLDRSLEKIRQRYAFCETCQGSVPEAIGAFLESDDYEQAIRKAIWLGGDADT